MIDKSKITVTMSLDDFEYYQNGVNGRDNYIKLLQRANKDGIAIMTDELKVIIEEIFL